MFEFCRSFKDSDVNDNTDATETTIIAAKMYVCLFDSLFIM